MSINPNSNDLDEKRKYPRINTLNIVNYILFDENRKKIGHGKGRALDLSQKGALLETEQPLTGTYIILMTLDLNENEIKIKGCLAHARKSNSPDKYLTGIRFIGTKDEQLNAIIAFVKVYHRNKYNL